MEDEKKTTTGLKHDIAFSCGMGVKVCISGEKKLGFNLNKNPLKSILKKACGLKYVHICDRADDVGAMVSREEGWFSWFSFVRSF